MTAFVPIAAAVAVIVAIVVSVALPRLLTGTTGSSRNPAVQGTSAAGPGPYPPFQVVVTVNDSNRKSMLLVESAATGHVVSKLAPPWHGAMWLDVSATADTTRFIVAAEPTGLAVRPHPAVHADAVGARHGHPAGSAGRPDAARGAHLDGGQRRWQHGRLDDVRPRRRLSRPA